MRERILQLVLDSFRNQFYTKALDCVKALREEAIKVKDINLNTTCIYNHKSHTFTNE